MPRKGEKMTEEARRKMAQIKRGVWYEVVCACGCGTAFMLPQHRIKSNKTGYFYIDWSHKCAGMRGAQHPNFRGGAVEYGQEWPRIAASIRERDGVCRHCGKTAQENGRALDVHHIVPWRITHDNSAANLIALCLRCHQRAGISEVVAYPELQPRVAVPCLQCGTLFVPPSIRHQLCSPECKRARIRKQQAASVKRAKTERPESYRKRLDRAAAYQKAHNERINAGQRASYAAHREERRAYHSAWRARNKQRAIDCEPS